MSGASYRDLVRHVMRFGATLDEAEDDPLDVLIDVEKLAAVQHRTRHRMLLAAGSVCAAALVVYWRARRRSARQ